MSYSLHLAKKELKVAEMLQRFEGIQKKGFKLWLNVEDLLEKDKSRVCLHAHYSPLSHNCECCQKHHKQLLLRAVSAPQRLTADVLV